MARKKTDIPVAEAVELLQKLLVDAQTLLSQHVITHTQIERWNATARNYLERAFGPHHPNIDAVMKAPEGEGFSIGMNADQRTEYLRSSLLNKLEMIRGCIDQLTPDVRRPIRTKAANSATEATLHSSKKVFIVHGHNGEAKESVARFLEKLALEPVILHECADEGRTIITKFHEESAGVGFAIVLMTPDDEGRAEGTATLAPRARQNVVFEFGFFVGKLGPKRVAAMIKGNVERPSDLDGVLYIPLDEADWRTKLVKELRAAKLDGDWSKALS